MSGNHTPTPWKVSPGCAEGSATVRQDGGEFQRPVAEIWHNGDDPKANAEFIVTAVNAFEANQARIAELTEALREMVYETTHLSPRNDDGSHSTRISGSALQAARAALSIPS